jgi:site-specific DNA-cytosine methylase
VVGHISVEKDDHAARVVEARFPNTIRVTTVEDIDEKMVQSWALKFSQAALVLIGAGPPCQGVSGLNAGRKGALRDARSGLFVHVSRIRALVKGCFPWAQVRTLMESVGSMDEADRNVMSADFGEEPWLIDALGVSLARRPRL